MPKGLQRLKKIYKKITFIEEIVDESGGITKALEDEKTHVLQYLCI